MLAATMGNWQCALGLVCLGSGLIGACASNSAGPDNPAASAGTGGRSAGGVSSIVGMGGVPSANAGGGDPSGGGTLGSAGSGGPGGGASGGGGAGATGQSGAAGAGGSPIPSGPAVAFPGALGFGRKATGGRGKAVYHVTNLNDAGAGSFRDAVSQSGRIVVFDVGGNVSLETAVSVKSDLTIAGQTAPGDGIAFIAREVSFNAASNVIVRYVRFRQGLLDPDAKKSGINLLNATNLILDHVSIEFAQYDNIDAVGATNITVQNSINANPTGQQFGAHTEMTGGFFTWYGNLFANAHGRCPLAKSNTQFVNNVVYNYGYAYAAGDTSGKFWHDLVNNYFIAGPSTTNTSDYFFQMNVGQTVYINGNIADGNKDGTLNGADAGYPSGTTHVMAASSAETASLPTTSAAASYTAVVAGAGASLHRDEVDSLVVANLTSLGTAGALWKDQTATGLANSGYGTLKGGTAPIDTDKDGMPDAWEGKHGLDPNSAADASGDFDHTGYTNVEKYIDGIADGLYP